jgi:hypothetical protein
MIWERISSVIKSGTFTFWAGYDADSQQVGKFRLWAGGKKGRQCR